MSVAAQGVTVQKSCKGAQDCYLTVDPQFSFMKVKVERYVDFAIAPTEIEVQSGSIGFSKTLQFKVERNADFAWRSYLKVLLPQLSANSGLTPPQTWVHYQNAVALALLQKASLWMGGNLIDQISGLFLDLFDELCLTRDKSYARLVGKCKTRQGLIALSTSATDEDRLFYVPLVFCNYHAPHNSILLTNSGASDMYVKIETSAINTIAQVATYTSSSSTPIAIAADQPYVGSSKIAHGDIAQFKLLTYYIFTDKMERIKFVNSMHEVLITQTQEMAEQSFTAGTTTKSLDLLFNHPVSQLWVVQRSDAAKTTYGNLFDYYGRASSDSSSVMPIANMQLQFGYSDRLSKMEGKFFRDVISQDHFAKMPQKPIYPISFAYYPLDHTQASGSANMSKIDKPVLTVFLTSGLAAGHIIVIARNWNVLRYINQSALLAYAS